MVAETPILGKVGVMSGSSPRRYQPEPNERAVRTVGEVRGEHEPDWAAMARVAELHPKAPARHLSRPHPGTPAARRHSPKNARLFAGGP